MKYYHNVLGNLIPEIQWLVSEHGQRINMPAFAFPGIDDIAFYVGRSYYADKAWHFGYKVSSIINLIVVECYRKLSFENTISSLTNQEARLLCFEDDNGIINFHSMQHFIIL